MVNLHEIANDGALQLGSKAKLVSYGRQSIDKRSDRLVRGRSERGGGTITEGRGRGKQKRERTIGKRKK